MYKKSILSEKVEGYVQTILRAKIEKVINHNNLIDIKNLFFFKHDDLDKIIMLKLLKDEDCIFEIYDTETENFL